MASGILDPLDEQCNALFDQAAFNVNPCDGSFRDVFFLYVWIGVGDFPNLFPKVLLGKGGALQQSAHLALAPPRRNVQNAARLLQT